MVLSHLPGVMRISGVDTFAYLGQQVLDQQPEHVREFLMRTSMPEEFNAEFCEVVLAPFNAKPQNWYVLMSLIFEKNLFVLPLGSDGRWLRYHPLFREFLQTRLKEERPHEVQPILQRMVKAYEKAGEWEKAYFTCRQLNEPGALAGVIERAGSSMLQSALVTLEGWINSLPPSLIQTRPGLISLRGIMAAMKSNLQEAGQLLDTAVSIYRKQDHIADLTLALIRRAHALRLSGKYHASLKDIEEALHLAEPNPDLQPLYAEGLRLKGLNLYRLGESRSAVEKLEHSLSLYTELKETSSIPLLLGDTAMVYAAVGEVVSAETFFHKALRIWQAEKNLYAQADTLNNLGVLYHQLGEYELASETYERGLSCARNSHNQRAESLLLTGLGDLYAEMEEFEAASHAYMQAEAISEKLPGFFISNYLALARANLALLKGDIESASQILKSFRKKLRMNPSVFERGSWALLEGRNHLLQKEAKKAIPLLQESKTCFIQDGRESESLWCMVWLTAAYNQAGQMENARTGFRELLAAGNRPSHALLVALHQASACLDDLRSDSQIGRSLSDLLDQSKLLSERIISVRRVLRRHAQSIPMTAASLAIRAFGRAEVSVNGRVITMSDWRTKYVKDLFFYFLLKQNALTKEQVSEVLWPETVDPHSLKKRFKDGVYRLRRAVGRNVIVFDEEYYRYNRALDYEYDVEAFDSHLRRARKARDIAERINWYQKAVDLVQGPYLAEVDADWAASERERLRQIYITALEELARLYLNTNQLDRCLFTCEQALVQNRYNEGIYHIEMRAHAARGDRASIVRCYEICKVTLKEGLGLLPSQATELLYQEFITL
jgi:two-component SAPR family response regulator/Flp pilus assembly protein TadD